MKQIPNLFTLLNLLCGCIAIVLVLQTGEAILVLDNTGAVNVTLPERIWMGSYFIFAAAVIDFLDGFLARLLKAPSEMGKQLDSLSDVVSFGVAPGVILYQLLRLSYAQEDNGLDVSIIALIPAFLFTLAAGWRLAKFNISTDQSNSFRGVPTPAAGLLVASLPLIFWYYDSWRAVVINKWFLYGLILVLGWLMVSNLRLLALKFGGASSKGENMLKYGLVVVAAALIAFMGWRAVPVIFALYVIVSVTSNLRNRKNNI